MSLLDYHPDNDSMRACLDLIARHGPRLAKNHVRLLEVGSGAKASKQVRRRRAMVGPRAPNVTEADQVRLRQLAAPGKSLKEIGAEWGFDATTVSCWLRKLGIVLPHKASQLHGLRVKLARALDAAGRSGVEIAVEMGISAPAVSALLKEKDSA